MAKLAKIPPLGGIVNIYKPAGPSSFQMVGLARKMLGVKKIGFDGTLDPFAEGVLPLYIGRACAAITYNEKPNKEYIAMLALGAKTDSQDSTGEILQYEYLTEANEERLLMNDCELVRKKLCEFLGKIKQEVPVFSAAKFNGKRFVDLFREGAEVPKRYKDIEVFEASLLDFAGRYDYLDNRVYPAYANFSYPNELYQARLRAVNDKLIEVALGPFFLLKYGVSSGTYIRTLNQELAKKLGTFGTTLRLLRTKHGNFAIENAISVDRFVEWCQNGGKEKVEQGLFDDVLRPLDTLFADLPQLRLSDEICIKLLQGRKIPIGEIENFAYNLSGAFADDLEKFSNCGTFASCTSRRNVVDLATAECSSSDKFTKNEFIKVEANSEDFNLDRSSSDENRKSFIKIYSADRFIGLAYILNQRLVAERLFLGIEDF